MDPASEESPSRRTCTSVSGSATGRAGVRSSTLTASPDTETDPTAHRHGASDGGGAMRASSSAPSFSRTTRSAPPRRATAATFASPASASTSTPVTSMRGSRTAPGAAPSGETARPSTATLPPERRSTRRAAPHSRS